MSWTSHFSESDYQHYWSLTPDERQQQIEDEQTSTALKALLLYQQGHAAQHQPDQAIAFFSNALALRPDWHEVWRSRGAVLLSVGEWDDAIASCERALELDPTDAEAWSIQGTALYRLKRYSDAADRCDRALEIDPNHHSAWRTLSDALYQLGRYEEAVVSYDKALDLRPNDPPAWSDRGLALQRLGRYDAAIASFDKRLELEPDNYKLWYQRGLVLRRLRSVDDAIADFDRALTIRPSFYAATRSKLFLLLTTGHLLRYVSGNKSLAKRQALQTDLRNVFDVFVKTKLPTLVVLALVVLASTHDRPTAIAIAGAFLLIATIGDLLAESRK
ncbi:tetratricopeptide repeat protein [Leptolyngbya sp. FACHB-36]|uniref:tetratricopeptide repeat protein n=1 Tax=Leptolyngbya sp. FACHB-36 TaxID=2692808 RepID=UPI0016804977|nr:tetratricopeptide repeat protein [Leptolyngbya sp. FACHB-36]MBD2019757.1 tetratricopeptide repeat protein [Leptolyngbya sp. FACHB-36]